MRLLIVYPTMERGGAEGYALTIARAALARGWSVEVGAPTAVATESLTREFHAIGAAWQELRIGRAATLLGKRPRFLVPWLELLSTLRRLRRARADVMLIVLPGIASCFPVQVAAALCGVPALSCFQLTPRQPWIASTWRRACLRWARRHRQAWTCVSEHNRNFVAQAFAVPVEELLLIRNGAPLAPLPTVDRAALLRTLDIPESARIVLSIARLGVQKAHAVLLEGIALLPPDYADVHFVWLGEGEQRPALEARIHALGLRERVHLPGFAVAPPWLAVADAFAFPTWYEGLPFSLVEAMAAGVPVAASNVSSIPEVLDDGRAGLLVENQPQAWADVVVQLLTEGDTRDKRVAAARAVAAQFDEQSMIELTLGALAKLAAPRAEA